MKKKSEKTGRLQSDEVYELINDLFQFISTLYAIKLPDEGTYLYFSKYLKKYFGFLTFEDLESAFELNSMNYLDMYLPKSGINSPDNKVRNFGIPSLSKVINAYMNYKSIQKHENSSLEIYNPITKKLELEEIGISDEQKHQLNENWCDHLVKAFEKYRDEFEETSFNTPFFICRILAKHGALDHGQIDLTEYKISLKIAYKGDNKNQTLIYKTFDKIITQDKHIEDYLKYQRSGVSLDMPY